MKINTFYDIRKEILTQRNESRIDNYITSFILNLLTSLNLVNSKQQNQQHQFTPYKNLV